MPVSAQVDPLVRALPEVLNPNPGLCTSPGAERPHLGVAPPPGWLLLAQVNENVLVTSEDHLHLVPKHVEADLSLGWADVLYPRDASTDLVVVSVLDLSPLADVVACEIFREDRVSCHARKLRDPRPAEQTVDVALSSTGLTC